ncbi:SMP-30/gluconolactonase/LRE family protein [Flavitalea sp.]|nr:SMP-30/gluconolactonase/LRE family protein [Flavitalea sp.]
MTSNLIIPSILIFTAVFATPRLNDISRPGKYESHPQRHSKSLGKQIQDTSPVVAPGAELQKISDQFKFTEGPAADKNGNVYFTDQPNNNIWKYDTKGNLTLFFAGAGRSNGLYIDRKGNIISCADENNELWQISTTKKTKVLVKDFNGKRLNGPNDLWIHPKGDIYFTDPFYKRDYWKHTLQEQPGQYLFYYNKKSGKIEPVDTTFQRPNGIVGTGDGKYLFVADIGAGKTYRYGIQADGKLSDKKLFAPQGSDGMTIDRNGNLYLSGKGVTVYNPAGTKIAQIPVPANWTANLCFSGKDKDVLFITASESVFTLKMKVKGY